MREIKFRAWDTEKKEMTASDFQIGNGGIYYGWSDEDDGYLDKKWGKEIVIMEYTGFNDEKGKEIYFGDILKYKDEGGEDIAEVVYTMNNGAGVLMDNEITDLWEDPEVHTYEIIGNIYENKELLK